MKRKFYLHRENEPMKSDTVVYRVWIGESVREQKILTRLMAWAFAQGATLRTWSEDIDYYLQYESERIFGDNGILNFGFVSVDLTASEMLYLVESQNWDIFEKNITTPKAFFQQMMTLYPGHLLPKDLPRKNPSVLAERRKNLSPEVSNMKTVIQFT